MKKLVKLMLLSINHFELEILLPNIHFVMYNLHCTYTNEIIKSSFFDYINAMRWAYSDKVTQEASLQKHVILPSEKNGIGFRIQPFQKKTVSGSGSKL